MRKIFTLTILIFALSITACTSEKSKPDADINSLCQTYLHGDKAPLSKINLDAERYNKEFIGEFATPLLVSSGIQFSDEQISTLIDAIFDLLKRSQFEVTTLSENGDNATVKISLSVFDNGINEENLVSRLPKDVAIIPENEYKDATINAFVSIFNEMQIVKTEDIVVDCVYDAENRMWMPKNIHDFTLSVVKTMLNMN